MVHVVGPGRLMVAGAQAQVGPGLAIPLSILKAFHSQDALKMKSKSGMGFH